MQLEDAIVKMSWCVYCIGCNNCRSEKSITITKLREACTHRFGWNFYKQGILAFSPRKITPKIHRGKLLGFFGKSSGIFSLNFLEIIWHFPPEIYPKNTRGKLLGFFGKSSGIFSRNFCATHCQKKCQKKWVRKWPQPQPSFHFPES